MRAQRAGFVYRIGKGTPAGPRWSETPPVERWRMANLIHRSDMMKRAQSFQLVLGVAISVVLVGCGGESGVIVDGTVGDALPMLVGAKALSNHYVEATFTQPAGEAAEDPANYAILDPDGNQLPVQTARLSPDQRQVLLTTEPQKQIPYSLIVATDISRALLSGLVLRMDIGSLGFVGSSDREPFLESAISLSDTSVLLTFNERMDRESAEDIAFYRIADPDGNTDVDITITDAVLDDDETSVVLTTTPQENIEYTISVTNVKSRYTCSDGELVVLDNSDLGQGDVCAALFNRPLTTEDLVAPFAMGARTLIDTNAPLDPEASGSGGAVVTSPCGAGVMLQTCGGSESISGSGTISDEELIFTLNRAFRADRVVLGLQAIEFATDEPVLFVSSVDVGGYDITITEPEIMAAFAGDGISRGKVLFEALKSLPYGTQINALKLRETNKAFCVESLCLTDGRRIDPTRRTVQFFGIPSEDEEGPHLLGAVSISGVSVLLSFSEPLDDEADDPMNFSIIPELIITGAELTAYNTQILLTTLPLTAGPEYTVTVSNANGNMYDLQRNVIDPDPSTASFTFTGQPGIQDASIPPRVVGAASTGNTSVVVTFSKPMGDSALEPSGYIIVQQNVNPEVGHLLVLDNACDVASTNAGDFCSVHGDCLGEGVCLLRRPLFMGPSRTAVLLTTASQNEVTYQVTVVNVQDQAGNELAPSELLVNPSMAAFPGTPPTEGEIVDSDGDGLSDSFEQRGRRVVIILANGDVVVTEVTSDQFSADTDQDGLDDGVERQINTNPRAADTDGDRIGDYDEFNVWYSSPIHQDTDADGLDDYREITFYKTSALFADTDGDQIPDDDEVRVGNRDPRIADLPGHRIQVGEITLALDTKMTRTDTEGYQQSANTSRQTSLTKGESETYATSDTDTTTASIQARTKLGVEVSFPKGGGVSGEFELTAGFSEEHATNVGRESVESSEKAYQESLETTTTLESVTEITTEIVDATIEVDVTVENVGSTAFSVANLELSALRQDPRDRQRLLPVASLKPANEDLVISLGPLITERGPFIFSADEVFVSQVQELMKSPAGVFIKVANFDITDEFDRNFAFTSQEIFDRTAGIVIDFGDGTIERARVAVNSTFDMDTGRANGISLRYALEDILGFAKGAPDGYDTTLVDRDGDLVEILTRVRDVRAGTAADPPEERRRFWVVFSNNDLDPTADFDDLPLNSGFELSLAFVQDKDDDKVFAREEFLYDSSDRNKNTDGCPDPGSDGDVGTGDDNCDPEAVDCLGDFEEITEGWLVEIEGKYPFMSYPDPVQPDSDGDRLLDHEERCYGTDPRQRDTDLDGLSDYDEVNGITVSDVGGVIVYIIPRYRGQVVMDGGDSVVDSQIGVGGNDVQEQVYGATDIVPGSIIITDDGGDGIDGPTTVGGDDFIAANHPVSCDDSLCIDLDGGCPDTPCSDGYGTDPRNRDTDGDAILDGAERDIAHSQGPAGNFINPNNPLDGAMYRDADRDGIADMFEEVGYETIINGYPVTVTSNKYDPDSDDDLLPDLLERYLGSDPSNPDTDEDGLSDLHEFKEAASCIGTPCGSFATDYALFKDECLEAEACSYADGDAASWGSRTTGTNINEEDSDSDGRDDPDEINGHTITINGQTLHVYSDPLNPNSDTDNWNDGQEYSNGTNPRVPDSDADGKDDHEEGSICADPPWNLVCRDPRNKDRKIKYTYTQIAFNADCEELKDCGDYDFLLFFKKPTDNDVFQYVASQVDLGRPNCTGSGGIDCGDWAGDPPGCLKDGLLVFYWSYDLTVDKSISFIAQYDDVFEVYGELCEIDGGYCDNLKMVWGPEGCVGCRDVPNVTNDTRFTVDATLENLGGSYHYECEYQVGSPCCGLMQNADWEVFFLLEVE